MVIRDVLQIRAHSVVFLDYPRFCIRNYVRGLSLASASGLYSEISIDASESFFLMSASLFYLSCEKCLMNLRLRETGSNKMSRNMS